MDFNSADSRSPSSHTGFGRPLKMDRQIVVAVVAALEEWLSLDHQARFAKYQKQVQALSSQLSHLKGLKLEPKCFTMDERFVEEPINCLLITFTPSSPKSRSNPHFPPPPPEELGALGAELGAGPSAHEPLAPPPPESPPLN